MTSPVRAKFIVLILLALSTFSLAQETDKTPVALKYGATLNGKRTDEAMNKWRANRLGQFIHWGLYAIPGGEWNGKVYPGAAEWLPNWAKVPAVQWDALEKQFNPTSFEAKAWAKTAKQMGVKYMMITTKHHEGFCLWDSKYTDFDVAASPYKKDILKQLVEAYNAEGIDVGFYYSVLDWHHPDWRSSIKNPDDEKAFARYLEFASNQLRELAENYPTVKAFWFDGTWNESVKKNGKWTYDVEMMLKKIRPGVVVNSRLRADDFGKRHFDSNGRLMGDYESGYERKLPQPWETKVTEWDWEACMTIPENQWGYHKDWSLSHVKSTDEVIEWIVKAVSMGGNMLVNFGPKADGTFRIEEQKLAREIGDWMKINGAAIYGTDYAGLEPQGWGYFTKNKTTGKYYAVVFNTPISKKLRIKIPSKSSIVAYKFLVNSNRPLKLIEIGDSSYFLQLPEQSVDKPYVIEFEIKQNTAKKDSDKAKT